MSTPIGNVPKLAASSLLAGLVFWYGIEKLFMQDGLDITALGVGVAVIALQTTNVLLDIPFGVLADLWSRKGVLVVSAVVLLAGSLVMGASDSLPLYVAGVVLYGVHVVTMFGTADSLLYDTLNDADRADEYTRIGGRVAALNIAGYALGALVGGLLATVVGYRGTYALTAVPALLMLLVVLTLDEPRTHNPRRLTALKLMRNQIGDARRAITGNTLLATLFTVMCLLWIGEVFKEGFGQLYILRYIDGAGTAAALGALWAVFYLVWSLGSWFAHWFDGNLRSLIYASVAPLAAMAVLDHWVVLVLFMGQAFAAGALFVQIGNLVHEATPSEVRTTVLSVKTFVGRLVTIPAIYAMGWATDRYDVRWALYIAAFAAVAALVVWIRPTSSTTTAPTLERQPA